MTRAEIIEALIGRGYFPKELPPPFTTQRLAAKITAVVGRWDAVLAGLQPPDRAAHPRPSRGARFDMARKGHARRTLAIPNPVNQLRLCEAIANDWAAIVAVSASSTLSLTPAEISRNDIRAVPMPPFSELPARRIKAYAAHGAILQTDIQSFYSSIYTHSIPWALHTKAVAKQRRRDQTLLGNRLDRLVQSCQDGQTLGLPVGPDTSRVLSELLACAVEGKLGAAHGKIVDGYRYIDDFFLCCNSLADADLVLAALREAVLDFDLQLNPAKTRTIPALAYNEETWPNELASVQLEEFGRPQRKSLENFFARVIALSKELPDESIARYAVRLTTNILVTEENWDLYEAFLIRTARENTNCLDTVVKILCTYAAAAYPITECVRLFIERLIAEHAPYNHHYEVAWALWLARSLEIRLSKAAGIAVARVENPICATLAFFLQSRRLISSAGRTSSWLGPITADDLRGEHWLLIFEAAARRGWKLAGADAAVASDPYFAALAAEQVSFFDTLAYNKPLKIPGIETYFGFELGQRKKGILKGAVLAARSDENAYDFEELGEDYGGEPTIGFDREDDQPF